MIDGINLFRFCRNNPINGIDPDGREPTFSELFKAERGDLFFGLGNVISGYRTWWGMISFRLDYMNLMITPQQAGLAAQGIYENLEGLYSGSERQKSGIINDIKTRVHDSIAGNESSRPWWVFINFPESRKNAVLRDKFIKHINRDDYKYALSRTLLESVEGLIERSNNLHSDDEYEIKNAENQWALDTGKKVITRMSKAALDMMIKSTSGEKVHFILDGLDIDKVIKKQEMGSAYSERSTTAAELRFLYRNRDQIKGRVFFYKNRVKVQSPWDSASDRWLDYNPKSLLKKVSAGKHGII